MAGIRSQLGLDGGVSHPRKGPLVVPDLLEIRPPPSDESCSVEHSRILVASDNQGDEAGSDSWDRRV